MLKSEIKADDISYEEYYSDSKSEKKEVPWSRFLDQAANISGTFTEEECRIIIKMAQIEWQEKPGEVNASVTKEINEEGTWFKDNFKDKVKEEYRNVTLWQPPAPVPWIMDKILTTILSYNKEMWKFNLIGMIENPNIMQYSAPSGQYNWHMDIGGNDVSMMRKLAYGVILNKDYEGGEFKIKKGLAEDILFPDAKVGDMFVFPTFLLHKVCPVTKGERYALVGWVHGPSFR